MSVFVAAGSTIPPLTCFHVGDEPPLKQTGNRSDLARQVMAPALLALAVGVTGARVLRWFGRAAVWVAAPFLPLVLVFGGIAEGTAETVGMSSLMGLFAGAWIVLGLALVSAETIRPRTPPSVARSRQ